MKVWKDGMEDKGLRVNMRKTKFMVSGLGLDLLRKSGAFSCAVCQSGVGVNSIVCCQCRLWVHKNCSGIQGRLLADPDYVCPRCCGLACPVDGRPVTQMDFDGAPLNVEAKKVIKMAMKKGGKHSKDEVSTDTVPPAAILSDNDVLVNNLENDKYKSLRIDVKKSRRSTQRGSSEMMADNTELPYNTLVKIQAEVEETIKSVDWIPDESVKSHHVLGSLQDYLDCSGKQRLVKDTETNYQHITMLSDTADNQQESQTNALKNWSKQMADRQRQQKHLSGLINVSSDALVMGQSDHFRSIQEERTIIDRAMPSMNYGKGYRVGSEFWKQAEMIGGGDDGISITLNQTERGHAPPLEHVGYSNHTKKEMFTEGAETRRMLNIHKGWHQSEYLKDRKEQLENVINNLIPHKPDIEGLEVIGKSISRNKYEDETQEEIVHGENIANNTPEGMVGQSDDTATCSPITAPSLLINGQIANWQGPPTPDNVIGMTVRLLFETDVKGNASSHISITNQGCTVIFYQWEKMDRKDFFNIRKPDECQKFYFSIRDGTLLPGRTVNIPFYFKTPKAGIFMETWLFKTQPVLCAGRLITVVLKGVATQADLYEEKRKEIHKELLARENKRMVERIILHLFSGIKTPPRAMSPIDKYITDEDNFNELNRKIHYKASSIWRLNELYSNTQEPDSTPNWDFSVQTIFEKIMDIEDDEKREEYLKALNEEINTLQTRSTAPLAQSRYNRCYVLLCNCVDQFVLRSLGYRSEIGLPEKHLIVKVEAPPDSPRKPLDAPSHKQRTDSKSTRKETPTGRSTKTSAKDRTLKKDESMKSESAEVQPTPEIPDLADPNYRKYLRNLYVQVYNGLGELATNIESTLS